MNIITQISKGDFWACLLNFLVEELYHGQIDEAEISFEDLQDSNVDMKDNIAGSVNADVESDVGWDEDPNCFELLHSRFAQSRRLKYSFFLEEISV